MFIMLHGGTDMAVLASYTGYYDPLSTVPDNIKTEWETTLKGERARILSALIEKITNADEFKTRLSDPAYDSWKDFISSDWLDADLIKLKFRTKLGGAYSSWNTGVQNAFASGGTFETNVTNKKDKFVKARFPMGAVGIKYSTGWLCAYKAMGTITGDKRVLIYADPTKDTWSPANTVANGFPAGVARNVRAIGIGIIVQGLVIAQYAVDAGLTTERDAIISAINTKFDNTVEKLGDTGKTISCSIAWDSVAGKLKALASVSTA
jgi:hypothetical protein